MGVLDVVEPKNPRRTSSVWALGSSVRDFLKWDIGEGILLVAESERTRKEAQMDSTGHVHQRIERGDRIAAAEESSHAHAPVRLHRRHGVQERRGSEQFQYCIDAARMLFTNTTCQVWALLEHLRSADRRQRIESGG